MRGEDSLVEGGSSWGAEDAFWGGQIQRLPSKDPDLDESGQSES